MGRAEKSERGGTAKKKGKDSAYLVFVSHATADKWIAKRLCEEIEAVGAESFRDDRDIAGGDDIPEQIRRQIIRSNEMVVLLTPESVDRPWVLLEVEQLGEEGRRRESSRSYAMWRSTSFQT